MPPRVIYKLEVFICVGKNCNVSKCEKGTQKFATTLVIMVSVNFQHTVAINIYKEKILKILKRSKKLRRKCLNLKNLKE